MFKDTVQLFSSPARLKLLKYFVYQPNVRISAQSAGGTLGIAKARTAEELRALVRLGFLMKRKQGKAVFELNQSHPLVGALTNFLGQATYVEHRLLTDVFRGTRGVVRVIASGVLLDEKRSSLDLLIIARKKNLYDQNIARVVKRAERLTALPLRYAVLELHEFEERFEARDRLLRDIFEFKHAFLIGRDREAA